MGFPDVLLIQLRKFPSPPGWLSVFIMKGCWVFPNVFPSSVDTPLGFPFVLFMCFISLSEGHVLNHPCIPGINHS